MNKDNLFDGSMKYEDAVAFFRYSIILPLLDAEAGTIRKTAFDIASKTYNDPISQKTIKISERTIFTYYSNYRKHKFEGLKPKIKSNKGASPSIPEEIVKEILLLKEELPTRSAQKIVTMLELARRIDKGLINIRTIGRILKHHGYTREALAKRSRVYVKHEKEAINMTWQSDVMQGFYIPDVDGTNRIVYLIGFIDDHSRRILHCQFYFDATLTRLEDCLKKAITKHGVPESFYIDNGKIYIANDFKLICAKLGIKLRYSTPYQPSGKGKIEVFWKYVETSFMPEIRKHKLSNIIELNDIFQGWLLEEYHNKIHASLNKRTPLECWQDSIDGGTNQFFISPVELNDAFLHFDERVVTKYGIISFEGNTYEIDGQLVGKKITIRYSPFHLDFVHVYFNDKYFGTAKIIDLKTEKHKSVSNLEEDPCVDSEVSKQYLNNIKSRYQSYLEDQLKFVSNRDIAIIDTIDQKNTKAVATDEPHGFKPPKEKTCAIERNEFIDIIATSLDVTIFSFAEKGKLYELWDTFKEFNKDILESILCDIKEKSSDYNNNFLFYLSQLRTMYNAKLNILKPKGEIKNEHKSTKRNTRVL